MRTYVSGVAKSTTKFYVMFESYEGDDVCSRVQSDPLFETELEAYAAGYRALDYLQEIGKFPNMCEYF